MLWNSSSKAPTNSANTPRCFHYCQCKRKVEGRRKGKGRGRERKRRERRKGNGRASAAFAGVPGSIPGWGVCDFFFSVSAKASLPISLSLSPFPPLPFPSSSFPFPSPFDLSFALKNASSHLSHYCQCLSRYQFSDESTMTKAERSRSLVHHTIKN